MKDSTNISDQIGSFPWDKIFPDLLWIIFWLIIILLSKDIIKTAITSLLNRLKHGAGIKIGSFELQELKVIAGQEIKNNHFQTTIDNSGLREIERVNYYSEHRGAMIVHKLYKSQKDGQLYEILIYLIPKKNSNLIQVISVEYYFGKFWGSKIFTTTDRSNGFAIATSAYGPFLCTAKINFNDGKSATVYRFIDFEMGDIAPMTNNTERTKASY
ncbi:MAG: hypothetical protein IPF54_07615 [Draconibacterium sp.]|nr:hypothetical protein [Draconibacterium sp.]